MYSARTITEAGQTLVVIEDKKHHAFAKFWRLHPENAVAEITEIASLRSRGAFEARFWFDGDYERSYADIRRIMRIMIPQVEVRPNDKMC